MISYTEVEVGETLIFISDVTHPYLNPGDLVVVDAVYPNHLIATNKKGVKVIFRFRPGAKKLSKIGVSK